MGNKKWVDGRPDKQLKKPLYDKDGNLVEDANGKVFVNGVLQEKNEKSSEDETDVLHLEIEDVDTEDEKVDEKLATELYNQRRIDESRAAIIQYNDVDIYNFHERVNRLSLLGEKVLVRFKRLQKYSDTGLYLGELRAQKLDRENVRISGEPYPDELQVSNMAVIVKAGTDVPKGLFKPKDTVYVNKASGFERNMIYLDQYSASDQFDNYYLVDYRDIKWVE